MCKKIYTYKKTARAAAHVIFNKTAHSSSFSHHAREDINHDAAQKGIFLEKRKGEKKRIQFEHLDTSPFLGFCVVAVSPCPSVCGSRRVAKSIRTNTPHTTKKKSLLSAGDCSKFTHHAEHHTRAKKKKKKKKHARAVYTRRGSRRRRKRERERSCRACASRSTCRRRRRTKICCRITTHHRWC